MNISLLYKKKKYLIQNLFSLKKKFQINFKNFPLPKHKNKSCFFFPVGSSQKFSEVITLRNIVTTKKTQCLYESISFNTQNSLTKKSISCEPEYEGKSYRKSSIEEKSLKVFSPLTGNIIKVLKSSGIIEKNETILIIDAMKMENKIFSPEKGNIILSELKSGMSVKSGDLLFTVEKQR